MIYYFDNCATTKVDERALEILNTYHTEKFFNPSAMNSFSAEIKQDIKNAQSKIANCLGANAEEIFFTSGGTESDNTAIFGCLKNKTGNIVLCATEHSAVYNCAMQLKNKGYEIRLAKSMGDGSIDAEHFLSLVDQQTLLAIMMHVNNETGAINDIKSLSASVKSINKKTVVFSDGVQAIGKVPVSLNKMNVDLYSFSGHKIHCSKGTGCLYVKKGQNLTPLIFGGGQQANLRSGTEYVGGIVALSHCVEQAVQLREENCKRFEQFKKTIENCLEEIGNFKLICPQNSADAILSVAFERVKSEVLVRILEQHNIIVGTSSACSSKSKLHRVHIAIGLPQKYAEGVLRISFSKYNDQNQVEYLCEKLKQSITEFRGQIK